MSRWTGLLLGFAALGVLASFLIWFIYTLAGIARRAKQKYDKGQAGVEKE